MDTTALKAFAVELSPHSPTHWVATFYPLVHTPAGHWADVTWVLHQCLLPPAPYPLASARWLQACSPDPGHSCYDHHRDWAGALAAGYATARVVHAIGTASATESELSPQEVRQLRQATVVVPPGQLAEWLLHDLQDAER